MSLEAVTQIIGRALVESAYRALLFDDPPAALAGYALTDEEALALRGITREEFSAVETALRERIALTLMLSQREPSVTAQNAVQAALDDLFDWER